MPRVAVGGTFEIIHKGHRVLLATAFSAAMGDEVLIGLTADHLANMTRSRMVSPYKDREWALRSFLDRAFPGLDYVIEMIDDEFGPAVDIPDLEVLVVSETTHSTGVRLNEARVAKGLAPLRLLEISHVLADDGKVISSTRILAGEVDADGRVVSS